MTGQQFCETARDGDAMKVSTVLSTQVAQSFINYQDARGTTPFHITTVNGHAVVTELLIAASCIVDLQNKNGFTPLIITVGQGHTVVTKHFLAALCNVDLQTENGYMSRHCYSM